MNNIIKTDMVNVMKNKYLDYAISVIVGRALPDVRDGLKPVHRRIIYSMYDLKLSPESKYRKSARIVGDVLGKYHPHGDTSVYDAMVRMAQDFSLRYPLINGHGNWGSVDGDSAAAYRYTEAKMQEITMEMLRDINKNTVDFINNFDGEEKEPSVLPSRFPNLLVNGSEGIAVGLATAIPPHNLGDTIETVIYQIKNPQCTIEDLVKILKAPDFPTGATIINQNNMINIYSNGQGKITMRSKYHIEKNNNKTKIIVTEIPYQANKSKLIENIYDLTHNTKKIIKGKEKIEKPKINGVKEIIDESDREGMRISIEVKKENKVDEILSLLFKHSKLQCDYDSNFTATYIDNKNTKVLEHLSLKQIINYYIEHQENIIKNRSEFELNKSKNKLHILNGLKIAIENIDKSINLIKQSKNKKEANDKLMKGLNIDDIQSNSILKLELQRLTGLEIKTIEKEYNNLLTKIKKLKNILKNKKELLNVVVKELQEVKEKFDQPRKTEIIYEDSIQTIKPEEEIEEYSTYVTLSKQGYLHKLKKRPNSTVKLKDEDRIISEAYSSNKSTLLLFSNKGVCYKIYEHELEEKKPSQLGEYLPQLLELEKDEKINSIVSTLNYKGYLINCFKNGKIAKVDLKSFKTKTKRSKLGNAINLESKLINQFIINKNIDIICKSSINKILIINTIDINSKGSKNTKGVNVLKSKESSTMKICVPLNAIDVKQLKDIDCYRGKTNAIGKFLKKKDKISFL